jgi:hypothetical protein
VNTYANGTVSIPRLMRYDRAFSLWWPPQLVAVFFGFVTHIFPNLDSFLAWGPGRRPVEFDLLYLSALTYFVLTLFMTGVTRKSADIYMTMPISTRKVWLSRYLSSLTVTEISVALMTLVAAFRMPVEGPVFVDGYTLRLGFHTGAALALLLTLLQLPFMELGKIKKIAVFAAYGAFMSAAVVFAAIVTVGITFASWTFAAGSLLLVLWILQEIPRSFSTMPAEAEMAGAVETGREDAAVPAGERAPATAAVPAPAMSQARARLTIARALINKWNFWLDCFLLVFYSMMVVNSYYNGARDNPWWLFGYVWIFAALMHGLSMVRKVDYLPVSRKSLFAMTMAPVGLAILVGMCAGWITMGLQPDEKRLISFYDGRVQIPLEFYEISADGPPPVLASLWGEFHQPESHSLFGDSRIHIYKPFDTGPESSERFVALQVDRAAEAVYGIERNPLEKYEKLEGGLVRKDGERCFTISKSIGGGSDTRSRVFALLGIITALIYSVLISLQVRYSARYKAANMIIPGAIILKMLIIGLVVLAGRTGHMTPSFVEAVPLILVRKLGEGILLPTPALWFLFAAAAAAGYLMMQRAYAEYEAPLTPASKTKIS